MVYFKSLKITMDIVGLAKVIIYIIIQNYSFLDFVITNKSSVFTSKFSFMLYYFLGIKQKLLTIFYL